LLAFRQCPKRLWLEVHRPDLRVDTPETEALSWWAREFSNEINKSTT